MHFHSLAPGLTFLPIILLSYLAYQKIEDFSV